MKSSVTNVSSGVGLGRFAPGHRRTTAAGIDARSGAGWRARVIASRSRNAPPDRDTIDVRQRTAIAARERVEQPPPERLGLIRQASLRVEHSGCSRQAEAQAEAHRGLAHG